MEILRRESEESQLPHRPGIAVAVGTTSLIAPPQIVRARLRIRLLRRMSDVKSVHQDRDAELGWWNHRSKLGRIVHRIWARWLRRTRHSAKLHTRSLRCALVVFGNCGYGIIRTTFRSHVPDFGMRSCIRVEAQLDAWFRTIRFFQ